MHPSVLLIAYLAIVYLLAMLFFWLSIREQNTEATLGTQVCLTLREGQTILGVIDTTEIRGFCIGKMENHVHDEEGKIK
jgi:hypothetical protein